MAEFRVYPDAQGYWRWTLYANNWRKVADSGEGYGTKGDCVAAVALVKQLAPVSPVNAQS